MDTLRELLGVYYSDHLFLAVWLVAPLVAGVIAARWRVAGEPLSGANTRLTPALAVGLALFAAFVATYVFLIYSQEELVGRDYGQLTAFPFYGLPIRPQAGRFFPLAFQEYNLLTLIGRTPLVYHTFSVLQLLALIACIGLLLADTPLWYRTLVAAFTLPLTSVVISFFGLVFPERDLVFWLAVFLVCVQRSWFWGALVAAQFALYYKEPVFVLIGTFAVGRILLRGSRKSSLEIALLVLCGVFLALYAGLILPRVESLYTDGVVRRGAWGTLAVYAQSDVLLAGVAAIFAWRIGTKRIDAFWEPLAAGALLYAIAYVKLQLFDVYYLAPADFIGMLYLGRTAYAATRARMPVLAGAATLVAAIGLWQNVTTSAAYIVTRKKVMAGYTSLAEFLTSDQASHPGERISIFWPGERPFELMETSAFLAYKGLGDSAFVMKSWREHPSDKCVEFRRFTCYHADAPAPGDLVMFAPGNRVSPATIDSVARVDREVFRYEPRLTALERALRLLAPEGRFPPGWAGARGFRH